MKISVSVPATTANLGPGFDIWGIALALRNTFSCTVIEPKAGSKKNHLDRPIEFSFSDLVRQTGDAAFEKKLATDEKSLIFKAFQNVFEQADFPLPLVQLEAHIEIPPARGLGSSSTAVLAGMVLANEILRKLHQRAYSIDQLFNLAVAFEGHPDNIAPALFGGFVLSFFDEKSQNFKAKKLNFRAPVKLAGIIPHVELSTEKARKAVPKNIDLKTWAYQSSRIALATHLLEKPNWTHEDHRTFGFALEDKIHQQARAKYIVGMNETFAHWQSLGALGSYLSGSGTTLLAFWPRDANIIGGELLVPMQKQGQQATVLFTDLDLEGLILSFD